MIITKTHELTKKEFGGLSRTSLFEKLVSNKYSVIVGSDVEFENLLNTLRTTVSGPWYQEHIESNQVSSCFSIYVSCTAGIQLMESDVQVQVQNK